MMINFLIVIFLIIIIFQKRIRRFLHWRRWSARYKLWLLSKLSPENHKEKIQSILLRSDPFEFEEMILFSLARRGLQTRHNDRYTGDGGIDGVFYIGQLKILIQAKRWRGAIAMRDVSRFHSLCCKQNCLGVFVTTGNYNQKSTSKYANRIMMVNDQDLRDLMCGKKVRMFGATI